MTRVVITLNKKWVKDKNGQIWLNRRMSNRPEIGSHDMGLVLDAG